MSAESREVDVEHAKPHEIQRDEDVLSFELQRELESVGSAVGLIAAVALLASQLGRAKTLVLTLAAKSADRPAEKSARRPTASTGLTDG